MARTGRGFSPLNALVGAAVAVVAVGLLAPAAVKVRVAAERARCNHHLKQLATATLAYHDARGHFPPGGSARPNLAAATPIDREAGGWTWAYAVLPYLGEERLYLDPDPAAVRRSPVAAFLCPARRGPSDPYPLAKTDYAANGGADADGLSGVFTPAGVPPLRLSDFRGGAGGVVTFAGRRLNRAALGASLDDDDAFATAGWKPDFEVYRTSLVHPAPDVDEPGILAPHAGFGSSHPGVFCAAFADGTVRPLRYSLDPTVWRKACHRDGAAEPPANDN